MTTKGCTTRMRVCCPKAGRGAPAAGYRGHASIHCLEARTVAAADCEARDLAEVGQNFTNIEPGRAGNDNTSHQGLRGANTRSISNSASSSEDLSPRATA